MASVEHRPGAARSHLHEVSGGVRSTETESRRWAGGGGAALALHGDSVPAWADKNALRWGITLPGRNAVS